MKRLSFIFIICWLQIAATAQVDSVKIKRDPVFAADTAILPATDFAPASGNRIRIKQFITPATLVTFGALADGSPWLKKLNKSTKNEIREDHPFFRTHIDDVMEYAPGVAVFGIRALGVKGQNTVGHEAMLYAMSLAINGAIVTPLKHITKVERPDGSTKWSFPSGHTSTAFASAEFLRKEYKDVSPWYGVAGYVVATATGVLRMYNNRHWLGDVVAGAGFGIASTNLAYLLYNKLNIGNRKNGKEPSSYFYPQVGERTYGIGMIKTFR